MLITIQKSGLNKKCKSIKELKEVLADLYTNMSVSLKYKDKSGAQCLDLVDVTEHGSVRHSYDDQCPYDFNELERTIRR